MKSAKNIANRKIFIFLRKSWRNIFLCLAIFTLTFLIYFLVSGYFAAVRPVTYLPVLPAGDTALQHLSHNQISMASAWYIVRADEYGKVVVETHKGETIMSALRYYAESDDNVENWDLENVSVRLVNDSTMSILGEGKKEVIVNLSLTIHSKIPKMDIKIRTQYKQDIKVRREALAAFFDVKVSEVYLKNRQSVKESFDFEYWLERQGVRFGDAERSALIYHTPSVSSLQLNTEKKLLFINLEYSQDHPYVNIPFQEDGGGKWEDQSDANYRAGTERHNYFSIYFGCLPNVTPRLMQVPYGYLAGYVFTEHADGGNLITNRSAYLGSGKISDIDSATGGFVGHRIPVTKSVFYVYPQGSSVRDDKLFLDFLDQLNETGLYDICLHTPDNLNSTREILDQSIRFMKERFDASTWIDHGFYNGTINRESFVCDGLDSNSVYYAADLWKKYDTRYFWNPASELINDASLKEEIRHLRFRNASYEIWRRYLTPNELKRMNFFNAFIQLFKRTSYKYELNSQKPQKGESYPTPLYWQNITRTGDFYSWVTDYVKDFSGLSSKKADDQIKIEHEHLNKLLSYWGVFINHGYFVRDLKEYNTLNELNGETIINPFFDELLGIMAKMRDDGDLFITTIRELLDYWILADNITFDYMPDGVIYVHNNNEKPVKGLSFVVQGGDVMVNNEIPVFRQVDGNLIFWFDIPPMESARLQIKPQMKLISLNW